MEKPTQPDRLFLQQRSPSRTAEGPCGKQHHRSQILERCQSHPRPLPPHTGQKIGIHPGGAGPSTEDNLRWLFRALEPHLASDRETVVERPDPIVHILSTTLPLEGQVWGEANYPPFTLTAKYAHLATLLDAVHNPSSRPPANMSLDRIELQPVTISPSWPCFWPSSFHFSHQVHALLKVTLQENNKNII